MKILLIDDNEKITDMLSSYLKLKDHDVTVSNDGRNGLSLMESSQFDATILDIAMPEFSGFDVMAHLKKDGKMGENRIVVLTAVPLSEAESDLLVKNGVHSILKKPANLQVLLKTITG